MVGMYVRACARARVCVCVCVCFSLARRLLLAFCPKADQGAISSFIGYRPPSQRGVWSCDAWGCGFSRCVFLGGESAPKIFWAPRNHRKRFPPMLGLATWHPKKPDKDKSRANTISALHGTTSFCASRHATCGGGWGGGG